MKGKNKSIKKQMRDFEKRLVDLAAEARRLKESIVARSGESGPEDQGQYVHMRMKEIETKIRVLWSEMVFLNAAANQEVRA